uniref:Uncharacterized protein n=1 Tax=Anopheles albimanus TaxID=7167 RepID=A0A182FV68_ANOAL
MKRRVTIVYNPVNVGRGGRRWDAGAGAGASTASCTSTTNHQQQQHHPDALNNNHHQQHHHHHHQHQWCTVCAQSSSQSCAASSPPTNKRSPTGKEMMSSSATTAATMAASVATTTTTTTPAAAASMGNRACWWCMYPLVGLIAALCYLNGIHGDFVHDDVPAITLNKDVLGLSPVGQVFRNDFWGTPMADLSSHKSYRPLTTLTFRGIKRKKTLCRDRDGLERHVTQGKMAAKRELPMSLSFGC